MSEISKQHPRSPGTFDQFAQMHAVNLEFVTSEVINEYERVLSAYVSELIEFYGMRHEEASSDLGHIALQQTNLSE